MVCSCVVAGAVYLINDDVGPEPDKALQCRVKVVEGEVRDILTNILTGPDATTCTTARQVQIKNICIISHQAKIAPSHHKGVLSHVKTGVNIMDCRQYCVVAKAYL